MKQRLAIRQIETSGETRGDKLQQLADICQNMPVRDAMGMARQFVTDAAITRLANEFTHNSNQPA